MSPAQNGESSGHQSHSATQNNEEGRSQNKRRRTPSHISPGDTAEHGEVKGNQSMLRRLRRRVHSTEDEVEEVTSDKRKDTDIIHPVNKGKEKEKADVIMKDESSTENDVNTTEVNFGQTNLSDSSTADALESSIGESSSQPMPSSATQNQDEVQTFDRPNSSSNVDGANSQSESTDQRHNRMRREIEQSLATAGTNQREIAQQIIREGNARPSMLSALLSDILGLRGARAGQDGQANAAANGTAAPTPSRNGGTSVIVQGALVSRTVPTTRTSSDRSSERSSQNDGATSTAQSNEAQPSESDSTVPDTDTASSAESRGTGEAQAATIEEQASMLVRLLSIATAATAASLLSGSQARANNATTTTTESAPNAEPTRTNDATSQTIPTTTAASATPLLSPTAQDQGNETSSESQSSTQTNSDPNRRDNTTSAWATQTFQSLRSRLSSFGSRFRGRNGTMTDIHPSRRRSGNESSLHVANIRRALAAAHANARNQGGGADRTSAIPAAMSSRTENREADSEAPSLSSLSNMLRDAIRDSLSHVGRGSTGNETNTASTQTGPSNASPTTSTDARPSTNNAESRIQSVRATLEAAREGHLNRGEEGSFDRFLYDLSRDLNRAVRALPPGRDEGASGENDHANANPQTGANATTEPTEASSRESDTRDGQLCFFRFFTFPEQRATQSASAPESTPSGLLPCIVVGVRSIEHLDDNGIHTANADLLRANRTSQRETQSQAPINHATNPTATNMQNAQALHGRDMNPFARPQPGQAPLSRFLLFVSGGHYPPQHPLFHASNDEASRDLMVLMEFLGAMAAAGMKVNETVTPEQIEKSDLRKVNGTKMDIETLTKLNQIRENTSEKCLICLEDWQDEGEQRRLLGCGHLFHSGCLDQWLISSNNSCPLCRRQAIDTSKTNGEGNPSSAEA